MNDWELEDKFARLTSEEALLWLQEHQGEDVFKLAFLRQLPNGLVLQELLEQVERRNKIRSKMPDWSNDFRLIMPGAKQIQQASSIGLARLKAALVPEASLILDLTGGSGIDSYPYLEQDAEVDIIEPDHWSAMCIDHNFEQLGFGGRFQVMSITAEEFLDEEHEVYYDLIYVDPDRRPDGSGRKYSFVESTPNVVKLFPKLRRLGDRVMIKASPMISIKEGVQVFGEDTEVHINGYNGECKEVLFLTGGTPGKISVNLVEDGKPTQHFEFTPETDRLHPNVYSGVLTYLYDPHPALAKSQMFRTIGHRYKLKKIAANTHLYTSDNLIPDFPGRCFRVLQKGGYKPKILKSQFKQQQASIVVHNAPVPPQAVRKQLGFNAKEGSGKDFFLVFGTNNLAIGYASCVREY